MMQPNRWRYLRLIIVLFFFFFLFAGFVVYDRGSDVYVAEVPQPGSPADCPGTLRLAVIGDYGDNNQAEADVAALVDSWGVDFVVTVGDNNYPDGEASTIDANIGQYYADFIYPYQGSYGPGATENRFFPALGNHDLDSDRGQAYFDYFTLPGNERYYDVALNPVHLFVLNTDPREINGRSPASTQAQWLKKQMLAADLPWKLVIMHHSPYTSSLIRRPDPTLQWPFAEWGATAVLSGHDHLYERLYIAGLPYIINGLGGRRINLFGSPEPQSLVRYNRDYGALRVQADETCINFSFFNRHHELIDSYTIN